MSGFTKFKLHKTHTHKQHHSLQVIFFDLETSKPTFNIFHIFDMSSMFRFIIFVFLFTMLTMCLIFPKFVEIISHVDPETVNVYMQLRRQAAKPQRGVAWKDRGG